MKTSVYPLGIQNFRKLREDGCIYVDKTAVIYDLVNDGTYYFLSRPRRFGKSLLVSTLEEFFRGNRELFIRRSDPYPLCDAMEAAHSRCPDDPDGALRRAEDSFPRSKGSPFPGRSQRFCIRNEAPAHPSALLCPKDGLSACKDTGLDRKSVV